MSDIYLVKNPLDPYNREHYQHEGPIIDLLQDIAPDGFDMPIRVFVNGVEIELDDLDMEVSGNDVAAILVTPGFLGITAAMVIQAVVSVAISLVLSLLFAPKAPGSNSRDENPTYNINVLRNEARLGKPIPVVYGSLWTTPDYAAKPYRFYDYATFDQYLDVLMCLGCGEFEPVTSSDLKIGNTTLNDTSAVQIKQFQMGAASGSVLSHGGNFGTIQQQLWSEGWNGEAPVFTESMYTSPEVDGWEFSTDQSTATTTTTAAVTWEKTSTTGGADVYTLVIARADAAAILTSGGRTLTISGSTLGNNGTYQIGFYNQGGTSAQVRIPIFFSAKTITTGADNITVATVSTQDSMVAGPYWTTPNADIKTNYIYLDFVAPRGIFWQGDRHIEVIGVAAEHPKFKIEIYDPAGALVMTENWTCPFVGNPDPVRVSIPIAITNAGGTALPPDRYKVKVTAQYTISNNQRLQNRMSLESVKSRISGYIGSKAYGDVTLLAVRIKATNGIASQSQNQLRVRAKRKFKLLDGSVAASGNPADIANDILTNKDYGASQSSAASGSTVFLDHANFNDCHQLWDNYKTDPANYPEFNGSFATADTVWNALQTSLSGAVAKPIMHHGQVKISRDSIKPNRAFLFNANNIVLDSFMATYSLASENEEDHVEVEYRDDELMEPAYKKYPTTVSGKTPQSPYKVRLFGCTDGDYAAKYARLVYNRRVFQRKRASFDTEMDGMLPMIGDRILVSSPQIRWGISGSVRFAKKVGGNWDLTLDALPDWTEMIKAGVTSYIVLTDKEGKVSQQVQIDPTGSKDEHVILDTEPTYADGSPFEIDISGSRDPARFAIMMTSGENARDMEITKIEHRGGTEFGISAVHYEVRQDNTGHDMYDGAPDHMHKDFDGSDLI